MNFRTNEIDEIIFKRTDIEGLMKVTIKTNKADIIIEKVSVDNVYMQDIERDNSGIEANISAPWVDTLTFDIKATIHKGLCGMTDITWIKR